MGPQAPILAMKISVLASGSAGNSTLIESGETRVLIDAGLNSKQLTLRLAQVGVKPEQISGIFLTHSHGDHVAGLKVFTKKLDIPIYATDGTQEGVSMMDRDWRIVRAGKSYDIDRIQIEAFSIPHDADEPVGYLVRDGEECYGQATDLGCVTRLVIERLRTCDSFLIESNYDQMMLLDPMNQRPWATRQRSASRLGHLSNDACAEALKQIVNYNTTHIVLGHISKSFNTAELARTTAQAALDEMGVNPKLTIIDPNSTTPTTI